MLQQLSERISLCCERAAEAREYADAIGDPAAKTDFLKIEQSWLLLARSYELGERLDDFVNAQPKPQVARPFDPHSLLQASGAAVFAKDKESRMVVANPACLSLLGKSLSQLIGRNDAQWHSDRVQARTTVANDALVMESGQTQVFEEPFATPLGQRIILTTKAPLLNDDGQIAGIIGVAKDVTERKRREEHTEFLRAEMAHRLKNTITLVQAMARRSLAHDHGFSDFEGRLVAYARSHNLLHGSNPVTLRDLVDAHLHSLRATDRLHVDGPAIVLPPDFAVEIGIALHELITNSIKHGALNGDGNIDFQWRLETPGEQRILVLTWRETHDRTATRAAREGFGHTVLARAVAQHLGGEATFEVMPGEVCWSLRATLPQAVPGP